MALSHVFALDESLMFLMLPGRFTISPAKPDQRTNVLYA